MSLLSKTKYFTSFFYPDTEIICTTRGVQMGCLLCGLHSGNGRGEARKKPPVLSLVTPGPVTPQPASARSSDAPACVSVAHRHSSLCLRGPVTHASFPVHHLKTENKIPHLPKRALFHKLKITLLESKSCYLITARMKGYGSIVLRPKLFFFFSTWLIPNPEGLLLALLTSLHQVEKCHSLGRAR